MWQEIGPTKRYAGTSGTVTLPAGAIIIHLSAHASTSGASVEFTDGQTSTITVPVPNGGSFTYDPKHKGCLVEPNASLDVVFTNTDAYFIEITGVMP